MNIKGLGIRNYRSFDSNGVYLDNLGKINILIGKNNSGKSNVLRFLQTLNLHISKLENFPSGIHNQHRRNGNSPSINIRMTGNEFYLNPQYRHNNRNFDFNKFTKSDFVLNFNLKNKEVELPPFFNELEDIQLIYFQNQYSSAPKGTILNCINENWNTTIYKKLKDSFSKVIYIPHLRVIKEGHNFGDSNSSINGSNIISKMFEMQNPTIGKEDLRDKFNLIQTFVRELINKPDLIIEIPYTKSEIVLTIDNNRLPLESFGTGIHQLVLLCSTLVIHEDSLVCIEEPEIHLHPELQRKFIQFLSQTNNTYFLTTHSNVLLDSNVETSIYHVLNDGTKSIIKSSQCSENTIAILNDLGYKSSDILQSNGIIWVEGPSDRTYLLKWLEMMNLEYEEGIHFSIMYYGGRLLSHLSFLKETVMTELIPLLKLNRNVFVIMDRDGFTNKTKLNDTKRRIREEIGLKKCWVTKGREIENYLSPRTISKWLGTKQFELDENVKIEDQISPYSKLKYATKKSLYSKEIIKNIDTEDINMLDLKQKINQVINEIKAWNN